MLLKTFFSCFARISAFLYLSNDLEGEDDQSNNVLTIVGRFDDDDEDEEDETMLNENAHDEQLLI